MKFLTVILTTALFLISSQAYSRDSKIMFSIEEAFASDDFKEKLDPDVQFFFGDQQYPKSADSLGTFASNKKTNAFGKSDEKACRWVFLSALISLQERVKNEGGNAVVNIVSYYKKNVVSSETEFECHAGNIMAGVALQGKVVKLAK